MELNFSGEIARLASVDIFKRDPKTKEYLTGVFIGRPFHLTYNKAHILVADAWKAKANGIPQGTFLLAYYENEEEVMEALLLRVLNPINLPTDSEVISSMIEYYKDNLKTSGEQSQLDSFTKYEFSFSGVECGILGTFYKGATGRLEFGADVENFYSANNYSVVKPYSDILELIVNFREGDVVGKPNDVRIGKVRYSSSLRFQAAEKEVPVFVSPKDFLGKRTALFGMTRTGKSNTVKKIIEATVSMSTKALKSLNEEESRPEFNLDTFTKDGMPKYPVGQIIFDINGEYANANMQDEGTAIFEIYKDKVTRYSVLAKEGFKVLKVNFYNEISSGFELVRSHLAVDDADYVQSFISIDLEQPEDQMEYSKVVRYNRLRAAYLCCLYKAGFKVPKGFKVKFKGNEEINEKLAGNIDPGQGISLEKATVWFNAVWDNYNSFPYFINYRSEHGREWADEDLKAALIFLSRKKSPGGNVNISGYIKLRNLALSHTETTSKPFDQEIIEELRKGNIIIIDLSQGDPKMQRLYSERICKCIFKESMARFISNKPNNYIQFYFEEAHNLFPKKEDKDLSQIYNRIAKEGAKLNLGLIYATQEVSSISSNILKNTQNWFVAHLNNEDEIREIKKYYDFGDFCSSLVRFSSSNDKGFVRMKTYSNPYVVPVQIDRFLKKGD